ncbi:hypothetical protein L0222_01290 [bacterium]|nr:hypothetical protein [bacterium]MCI0603181.1 hypothetical protein [bacterium]
MKYRFALLLLLLCQIATFVFSQDGRMVAVTAEQDVAIQNDDVAAARTIALSMAARAAVEKAYGTFIRIEELPEARKIIASAAAKLKFQVLAEQQRKNRYWVKIQAEVLVPAEYVRSQQPERERLGDSMNSFVQKYPQGEVNWGEGFIIAHGKGEITDTGPNGEDKATRAAEVDARAHLLEIIKDIPLDDRNRTGQEPRMSFALEGFVQGSEVVTKSKTGTTVHVTVQAPVRGVKGLTLAVLGYYTPPPPPPVKQPVQPDKETPPGAGAEAKKFPLSDARAFTGLVIDARKVQANASLFPKIQNEKKEEVYAVGQVNKEDLQKRGMASYAVVSRDASISKLFPKALVIRVSYPAQTAPAKTPRRQGDNPLILSSIAADGKMQTNLVLNEEDMAKLQQIAAETTVLKECRVIIVLSAE